MAKAPKTIPAGRFKTHCLAIMDEVRAKRQTVTVTKRGKPLVRIVPVDDDATAWYGTLRGHGRVTGDLVASALQDWGSLEWTSGAVPPVW